MMQISNTRRQNQGNELHAQNWHHFTYISDSEIDFGRSYHQHSWPTDCVSSSTKDRPLSTVKVGDRVCIVSLNCESFDHRLADMGLASGVEVEVVSRTHTGSVVVSFQSQNLGLGAGIAHHIRVTDVSG